MYAWGYIAVMATPPNPLSAATPPLATDYEAHGAQNCSRCQRFLESFEASHALRRGTVKLRSLVPRYRPTRASVHETARAVVMVMDVLGTQLKKAA